MTIESLPRNNKRFLANIQSLRAIATLMIVCSHWRSIDAKYSGDPSTLFEYFGFGRFAIDMFFVVSGFIMVYITPRSEGNIKRRIRDALKFLFARFTRIYPVYWLVSGALLLAYFIRPEWVFSSSVQPDLVKSVFLWPDYSPPLLAVAWTLVHELEFYLVFALTLLLPRKFQLIGLISWAIIVFIGETLGWRQLGAIQNVLFSPFSLSFIAGAFLAHLYKSQKATIGNPFVLWFLFALSILWAFLVYLHYQPFTYDSLRRVLLYIVPAILCVYSMCELNRQDHLLPNWLQAIGNWSFILYLTHVLTLSVIGRIWSRFTMTNTAFDNVAMFGLSVLATIIVAAISYNVLELPIRKITNVWRKKLFP